MVLRAPETYLVDAGPWNFGRVRWWSRSLNGLRLNFAPGNGSGRLAVQAVLRSFGLVPTETTVETAVELNSPLGEVAIPFEPPAKLSSEAAYSTIEPWLIWQGDKPLQLADTHLHLRVAFGLL